jgi:hypothetical protein
MVWIIEIEYRVTNEDHRLLVFTQECSREWTIAGFYHYTVTDPLPELCLRGPELLSRATDYNRRLLLLFGFLCTHSGSFLLSNVMGDCLAVALNNLFFKLLGQA